MSMRRVLGFVPLVPILALLSSLPFLQTGCAPGRTPNWEVPYIRAGSLVGNAEYATRRQHLMDEISDGIAIIPGATAPVADNRFFQSNDFFYFTGIEAPNAWLVVNGISRRSTLFLTLDEHDAMGQGIPPDLITDPVGFSGIEEAFPFEEMDSFLAMREREIDVFYLSHRPEELPGMNADEVFEAYQRTVTENPFDGRLTRELQLVDRLKERFPGVEIRDCHLAIQTMRKVKSPAEVRLVREAARIGVEAHLEFMRSTEVGMPERALAALFEFVSKREGAQGLAYETIIMAGGHHPWGHYHQYDRTLEDGDFIILDAGPEYAYYDADISTSFPANGRFTPEQRELYELGLGIRQVCLDNYRPGTSFGVVGEEVRTWLTENGWDPSERRFRGLIRWGGYNHPIGMATHDVMDSMMEPDELLEAGFVFACDINIPESETMGIRIEDTVVITQDGFEILSAGLPRTVEEIEALMEEEGLLQKVRR